jgi:hypothetical protein
MVDCIASPFADTYASLTDSPVIPPARPHIFDMEERGGP